MSAQRPPRPIPRAGPPAHAAALILDAFLDYNARFSDITRRARRRFEQGDWHQAQVDAVARIDLYEACAAETLARLESLLGERVRSWSLWAQVRQTFAALIAPLPDRELCKTYFNSLARRFFRIRGVIPELEFVALDIAPTGNSACPAQLLHYPVRGDLVAACRQLLADCPFAPGYADADRDTAALARTMAARLTAIDGGRVEAFERLEAVFYRERRAYLVGRLRGTVRELPLVVALINTPAGVRADALVTDPDQVSILFGYARSYFHADLPLVGDAVAYLHALLPRKPIDELYTVIGRAKQGKTERYRRLLQHLAAHPDERLVRAEGERGMVMSVFTARGYPLVFKLIRDRFAYPKDSGRRQVEQKYDLVFRRDRAGRLVDAQEFRQLRFPRAQFAPELLDELLRDCAETVALDGEAVTVAHCYVERRLRPLNLYAREMPPDAARAAVLDYGQAIKDLACSNIFPGDLLLKNFGVSRNGRAIFYDYDELCLLEECRFRALPAARAEDETRPIEDWLYVGPTDVFPELFPRFLGLPEALRAALVAAHGELFDPRWWRDVQARLRAGEVLDVAPYPATTRLAAPAR